MTAPGGKTRLRVLFVEDSEDDVILELAALRAGGFDPQYDVVDDPEALRAALGRGPWDVVLADYHMPLFNGIDAMRIAQTIDPDLAVIIVSGTIGEDFAVVAMRAGANDYILKDNLTRLAAAVDRELRATAMRREKRRIEQEQRLLAEVDHFLAEAGQVLGRTLDVAATIREAARLAVPQLADHAGGYVAEGGAIRLVEEAGAGAPSALDLPRAIGAGHPVGVILGRGAPVLIEDVTAAALAAIGADAGGAADVLRLGLRSALIVPLRGRARPIGALLFGATDRRYTERDLRVAADFAGRAGIAVENAQLYAQAQAAVQARDDFLALLGHELRNPLAPIVTAIHLARMRGGGALPRELQVIERQTRHLTRLVDDLLDVARVTRGKIALRCEPVEIAAVVAAAAETASALMEQRQHRLAIDVPAGLLVSADEARLAQILANLLTNAAKYTPPGGAIRVQGRRDGAAIEIAVIDTGVGMASDLLPVIFDPFVQGKRTPDRHEGGLGLGLALARALTELHGGTIAARSDGPGRGSEILVRLPALDGAPARDARPLVPADAPVAAARVLLVDDNEDAAQTLAEALVGAGLVVHVATDPHAALAAVTSFLPDVALLDIGLPEMDGYELAARLRDRLGGGVRLVAVTGYGQEADKARARAAGFHAHLTKPVAVPDLLRALGPAPAPGDGEPGG